MANTQIRLFLLLQKCFNRIGIRPYQSDPNFNSINWKNLLVLCVVSQLGISSIAYCLFKAKTIGECADAFYVFMSGIALVAVTAILIQKIDDIYKLIKNCEEFILKSMYKQSENVMRFLLLVPSALDIKKKNQILLLSIVIWSGNFRNKFFKKIHKQN